jgi:hypothetical protein
VSSGSASPSVKRPKIDEPTDAELLDLFEEPKEFLETMAAADLEFMYIGVAEV